MTMQGDVHREVSEVSKGEIEEKCGLDMSSYEDLAEGGVRQCNGVLHEEDAIVSNGKDDADGSYVFVRGRDSLADVDDPVNRDLNAECVQEANVSVGSLNEEIEVQVGELNVQNEELSVEDNCTIEGTVAPSNNDVALEGERNGNIEGSSDWVEDQNGTVAVESEGQHVDNEVKVEEQIKFESTSEPEESQECQVMVSKEAKCELRLLDDGIVKDEEQSIVDSKAEVRESQECQVMVSEEAECELPSLDDGIVKDEEQSIVDSKAEVRESQESQITIAESTESPENLVSEDARLKLDQENEAAGSANEILANGPPGDHAMDVESDLEMAICPVTDTQLKTEVANGSAPDENGNSLPTCHVEDGVPETKVIDDLVDGCQNKAILDGSSENAEGFPLPVNCMRSEVEGRSVPVESDESFPGGPDDSLLKVGAGASLITENSSSSAVDDVRSTTETEKIDASILSCPVNDTKSEIKVENGLTEGDGTLRFPANDEGSEHEIGLNSINCEEQRSTLPCEDVNIEPDVTNGAIECACSKPIPVDNLDIESHINYSVENESSLPNCPGVDAKSESEVENEHALSSRDIPSNGAAVSEIEVPCDTVVNSGSALDCAPDVVGVEKEADQSVTRPFYFLVRIPRYDDEILRGQIKHAQLKVEEKTRIRDAIRVEVQTKRATCKNYSDNFEAAMSEERNARDLLKSRRQEIDSVQSVINRVKNAISVDDIDGRIRTMEHMIAHETLPLKEEKQFIREIKQLKQLREQISSSMGKQDEVLQALDQRDQIEERLKSLKKEVDLLRDNVLKAEAITKGAKKKYFEETERLNELQVKFKAADDIRQEAYTHLLNLRKQLAEKTKYFRMYKDDEKVAIDYALNGDREALQCLCLKQVETMMELWNKNDEFRTQYIRCNMRSTLRRLRTLDGRSLGPDEEPPILPNVVKGRVDKSLCAPAEDNSMSLISLEQEKLLVPVEAEKSDDKSVAKVVEQKNQTAKTKKPVKPAPLRNVSPTVPGRDEIEEAREEEHKRTKEEEELARKAEELRKEEAAAKLKEQRRLEEKAKAKEALERKKRKADKIQARAELRARKEAEQKGKEMEKKAQKKERKKAAAAEATNNSSNEGDSAPSSETPTGTMESEKGEKTVAKTKKPKKPSQLSKHNKTKSIPLPLRNRGKRRMQPWMWVLITALLVLALFLVGNNSYSVKLGLQSFGF